MAVCRWRSCRDQRPVGDADRGHVEHGSKLQGQPGPTRMISSGCVDQHNVRPVGQGTYGRFQQRPEPEGQ